MKTRTKPNWIHGSTSGDLGFTATAPLSEEHDKLKKTLSNLTRTLENQADNEHQDAMGLIDGIAKRILRHMLKEETILFPVLRRHLEAESPVVEMLSGHDDVKTAVSKLQTAIGDNDRQHMGGFARRLCKLKLSHMRKEDRVLFHLADALLDNRQKTEIARDLSSERFHRRP